MAKRSASKQTRHDTKVNQIAKQLQKQGYNVKADLAGYQPPAPIGKGKKRPDIVAEKAGKRKIIEVETSETVKRDKKQLTTFRRSAAQRSNTSFEIEVVE